MPPSKKQGARKGGRKGPGKKIPLEKSGAQKRKERAKRAAELAAATPVSGLLELPPPPPDDLQLVLWGARVAATAAHILLTNPGALSPGQWRYLREYLATLGLLFPRAEMMARLLRAQKKRQATTEAKDVEPRGTLAPGPASRRRRGGGGTPDPGPLPDPQA